jgi:ribosomal protein S1
VVAHNLKIYMSIRTQTIEIYDDANPLDVKYVTVPVRKGQKIFCHEPYVLEAMKMYDKYCGEEVLDGIMSYEGGNFRDVRVGVVSSFSSDKETATIELSAKHSVLVDYNPKSEDLELGKKIDVVVSKSKGKITGDATSKTAQLERVRQELIRQVDSPSYAYVGMIKEVIFNGANAFNGFVVDVSGVKCFMPGSESDVVPLNDYNELVGQTRYVMPIASSKESIVVSHKEYLNTLKATVLNDLIETKSTDLVEGVVSSVKKFGVFIIIGKCVPTLLSVSEMDEETESKFKNGEIKVDDTIKFYVESVKDDRVTITQTACKSLGWDKLKETVDANKNYKLNGTVKNIFENGAVVVAPEFNNITFFLSSKVLNLETLSVGSEVVLPVENIDAVKKTVRLKITDGE